MDKRKESTHLKSGSRVYSAVCLGEEARSQQTCPFLWEPLLLFGHTVSFVLTLQKAAITIKTYTEETGSDSNFSNAI